jgi:hypothetical protein
VVVVDRGIVTSRKPDDIPAFNARILQEFAAGAKDNRKQKVAWRNSLDLPLVHENTHLTLKTTSDLLV